MTKVLACVLLFFFISGTFTTTFSSVSASRLVENSWNAKTPSPNPERQEFGVVAVEGKIYAIGGLYYTEMPYHVVGSVLVGNYLDTNECYDPLTDTWITLEPMPTHRAGFCYYRVSRQNLLYRQFTYV
ncbi:MAG: hypothetical protein FWD52_08795 [Candidatus Bathyarchaeota archaeon]|nr:hypothetical protein [Candidatus Termiticorpusculum sp.]